MALHCWLHYPSTAKAHTSLRSDVFRGGNFHQTCFSSLDWWMHWKWRRRKERNRLFCRVRICDGHFKLTSKIHFPIWSRYFFLHIVNVCTSRSLKMRLRRALTIYTLITSPYTPNSISIYRNNLNCCCFFLLLLLRFQRRFFYVTRCLAGIFVWIFHGAKKTTDQKKMFKLKIASVALWNVKSRRF